MPRRCLDNLSEDDPPKKRNCTSPLVSSINLKQGELLRDISGKQWKVGKAVGVGGFGEIYLASDNLTKEVRTDCKYVAKVENHKNGPLFVEINCYLRIARPAMIEEWKKEKKIENLGMPHYVASGSHTHKGEKYRFLIQPKFDKDLEKILHEKKMFNLKTVLTISLQIIDVLEYIHSKGYIHSDIKASNILLLENSVTKIQPKPHRKTSFYKPIRTCRLYPRLNNRRMGNLRPQPHKTYVDDIPNFDKLMEDHERSFEDDEISKTCATDQVYLLDYGLACKYVTSEGTHKPFCPDERKAHAGTILFCSRDAHKGVQSRRSDLESLGYNLFYWLTGDLPWSSDEDPEIVEKKKIKAMSNIENFLKFYYPDYPKFLEDYFKYLQNLQFEEKPDYDYCTRLFMQSLKSNGYKNDSRFDFNNLQTNKLRKQHNSENVGKQMFIYKISRPPLQSNIPVKVKPLLRKKVKDKKIKTRPNWFEEVADPEVILKQGRQKSEVQDSNLTANVADLNIKKLNPTYAMLEIYNKCREKSDPLSGKLDSFFEDLEGYTHAMKLVLYKSQKRKELECEDEEAVNHYTRSGQVPRKSRSSKKKFESPLKTSTPKTAKSSLVIKKQSFHGKKKNGVMRRSYSLRG